MGIQIPIQPVVDRGRQSALYGGLGHILKIKPPLNIPQEQLDAAIDVFDRVLGEVEATAGLT